MEWKIVSVALIGVIVGLALGSAFVYEMYLPDIQRTYPDYSSSLNHVSSQLNSLQSQISAMNLTLNNLTSLNVNVTNWPSHSATFPRTLVLRGAGGIATQDQFQLIDQEGPSLSEYGYFPSVGVQATLDTTEKQLYSLTFIYEKIPVRDYKIVGMPTISLTYNLTNEGSALFGIAWEASLGIVSQSDQWTWLSEFQGVSKTYEGVHSDFQDGKVLSTLVKTPITVNASQRLALQMRVYGYAPDGTTFVNLTLMFHPNTDELLVSVPIVESP